MLESAAHLVIGAGGTTLYLCSWSRALVWAQRNPEAPSTRHRRHLVHIVFLILLTPYVLALFKLMDIAVHTPADDATTESALMRLPSGGAT